MADLDLALRWRPPPNSPEALLTVLRPLAKGASVCLLLPDGNRGDGVIRLGTRALFANLGLKSRELTYPQTATGDVLIVLGGGAYSLHHYNPIIEHIRFYRPHFDRLIILPSTFDGRKFAIRRFLHELDATVTVFAREHISFCYLQQFARHAGKLGLADDLAFHLDPSVWDAGTSQETGAIIRQDLESSLRSKRYPVPPCDLSRGSPEEAVSFIQSVASYREIFTDRLHVAIVGALLGRRVHLFEGDYFKNRAVFDYSLRFFPTVTFEESGARNWRAYIARRRFRFLMYLRHFRHRHFHGGRKVNTTL